MTQRFILIRAIAQCLVLGACSCLAQMFTMRELRTERVKSVHLSDVELPQLLFIYVASRRVGSAPLAPQVFVHQVSTLFRARPILHVHHSGWKIGPLLLGWYDPCGSVRRTDNALFVDRTTSRY
jgi:hypothetical protein